MNDYAILTEGLGKRFRLRHQASSPYSTLRGDLAAWLRRLVHPHAGSPPTASTEEFWALRNVDVTVQKGDVLGVIGRNGAGKSTLLKLVSRIIEPSEGRIHLRGRVASLLEVGTGFHPELTGRENVYLNGAILGMTKQEIRSRFDEIVAFAEVEKFLDTPVKHYSSGMYMRLAFAVAAHLEPEILLVDEVLAVGDAEFQRKCLGKMKTVAEAGRTVLFVSHNMQAIQALCNRGLLMANGRVTLLGDVEQCMKQYAADSSGSTSSWARTCLRNRQPIEITAINCCLRGAQPQLQLLVDVTLVSHGDHKPAFLACEISDMAGVTIMQAIPAIEGFIDGTSTAQRAFRITIDLPALIPGSYALGVWLGSHFSETLDEVPQCVSFDITESPTAGRTFPHHVKHGHIVPTSYISEHSSVKFGD